MECFRVHRGVNKLADNNESYQNISVQRQVAGFGRLVASVGHVDTVALNLLNGETFYGDGRGVTLGAFYGFGHKNELYLATSLLDFHNNTDQMSIKLGFSVHFEAVGSF